MHRYFSLSVACLAAFALGVTARDIVKPVSSVNNGAAGMAPAYAETMPGKPRPTDGFTLHIDAKKHFGDQHPDEIAHHYCKGVAGGLFECQIYDSDAADAHLVAVETIVAPAVWKTFAPEEQALWHYHVTEIPKVDAKLPDMSPAEAKKTLDSIKDTYGKIWLLWDPQTTANPVGMPTVTVLR